MAVERSCFHMAVAGFSEIRESLNRFPGYEGLRGPDIRSGAEPKPENTTERMKRIVLTAAMLSAAFRLPAAVERTSLDSDGGVAGWRLLPQDEVRDARP